MHDWVAGWHRVLCEICERLVFARTISVWQHHSSPRWQALAGTTASREFTCLGVVYGVPEARELMHMTAADLRSQIALVEQDLTAYRSI